MHAVSASSAEILLLLFMIFRECSFTECRHVAAIASASSIRVSCGLRSLKPVDSIAVTNDIQRVLFTVCAT